MFAQCSPKVDFLLLSLSLSLSTAILPLPFYFLLENFPVFILKVDESKIKVNEYTLDRLSDVLRTLVIYSYPKLIKELRVNDGRERNEQEVKLCLCVCFEAWHILHT